MRLNVLARALLLLLMASGCSFGITNNAAVEVPGDLPVEEKARLAQAIASEVWEAGLMGSVLEQFPTVAEEDLSQFGIRSNVMTFNSVTDDDEGAQTTVHIQCSLRHGGGMSEAQEIVDFCERKVREAMRARGIEPPAA